MIYIFFFYLEILNIVKIKENCFCGWLVVIVIEGNFFIRVFKESFIGMGVVVMLVL